MTLSGRAHVPFGPFTRTFFRGTFARHMPARHAFGMACRNVERSALLLAGPEDRTHHYLKTASSGSHFYVDSTCFFQEPAQSCIMYYLFHVYYRSAKRSARHDRDIRRFAKSIRIPRYTWLIEDNINAFTVDALKHLFLRNYIWCVKSESRFENK